MADRVLVEIATALAARQDSALHELVRSRLHEVTVLDAAGGAAPDSAEVVRLADALGRAERADPAFGEALRAQWSAHVDVDKGGVSNQIYGTVSGRVIQARDIHGDIRFGG